MGPARTGASLPLWPLILLALAIEFFFYSHVITRVPPTTRPLYKLPLHQIPFPPLFTWLMLIHSLDVTYLSLSQEKLGHAFVCNKAPIGTCSEHHKPTVFLFWTLHSSRTCTMLVHASNNTLLCIWQSSLPGKFLRFYRHPGHLSHSLRSLLQILQSERLFLHCGWASLWSISSTIIANTMLQCHYLSPQSTVNISIDEQCLIYHFPVPTLSPVLGL